MNLKLKRTALSLKTASRPMSPDDFSMLNSDDMQLMLSYDFQIGKQAGKSFF
jgi:hypothetical protein